MQPIDKLAWVYIKDKKVLFVRSKDKNAFYSPGGKREEGETDTEALIREIKEELNVDLIPETITYLHTFTAQAHGKPEGVMVEIKSHTADFIGELKATSEIEELAWLTSKDTALTTEPGRLALAWLHKKDLID